MNASDDGSEITSHGHLAPFDQKRVAGRTIVLDKPVQNGIARLRK